VEYLTWLESETGPSLAQWSPTDIADSLMVARSTAPPRRLNQKWRANHSTPLPPDDNSYTTIPDSHIIRRYDAEGKSPTEIGELLAITAQSVRNVLAGFAEKGQLVDPGLQVLELLRQANCPDRKWPTAELLDAIGFSTKVRTTIERHWSGQSRCSGPKGPNRILVYLLGGWRH
jgi:hypothetical protein